MATSVAYFQNKSTTSDKVRERGVSYLVVQANPQLRVDNHACLTG
jgi:hypothetical protein